MKKLITTFLSLVFTLVLFAQTPDAMHQVSADEVPPAVLQSFEKMYPDQEVEVWLFLDNIYDASIERDGRRVYVRFNEEGLQIEERIVMDWESEAPEALKQGKNKTEQKYWDVVEFYKVAKEGEAISYILQLRSDQNELKTLYFDERGTLEVKSKSGW